MRTMSFLLVKDRPRGTIARILIDLVPACIVDQYDMRRLRGREYGVELREYRIVTGACGAPARGMSVEPEQRGSRNLVANQIRHDATAVALQTPHMLDFRQSRRRVLMELGRQLNGEALGEQVGDGGGGVAEAGSSLDKDARPVAAGMPAYGAHFRRPAAGHVEATSSATRPTRPWSTSCAHSSNRALELGANDRRSGVGPGPSGELSHSA